MLWTGDKIRNGPHVGTVASEHLPSRGGGQNQKWPACGHTGYLAPAVSGVPTALDRGQNHKWPTCGHSGYLTPAVSGVLNALQR